MYSFKLLAKHVKACDEMGKFLQSTCHKKLSLIINFKISYKSVRKNNSLPK